MSANPSTLVATARQLLERADPGTAGLWPRSTAFLTRLALEVALDEFWRRRAPGLEHCSTRAQLISLPFYLRDDQKLAERVPYTWWALTWACHQHPYELPPTSSELLQWLATVEQLVAKVNAIRMD